MDKLDAQRRSENMRRIRSKNTKPEVVLRSLLHRAGYRFRLHRRDLPGKPDIVFPGRRKVIFVHGYFWHQHPGCREGRLPGMRQDYWRPKMDRT
jgi:DNA mismatch endonuclease (patch repair protein)